LFLRSAKVSRDALTTKSEVILFCLWPAPYFFKIKSCKAFVYPDTLPGDSLTANRDFRLFKRYLQAYQRLFSGLIRLSGTFSNDQKGNGIDKFFGGEF